VIASGPEPPSPRSTDGIDRLVARLFAGMVALSWTGLLLAELGWFRPVPIFALVGHRRHRLGARGKGAVAAVRGQTGLQASTRVP
jgi:hypothetical protein